MPSRKMLGAAAMTAALAAGGVVGATVGYPSVSGAQKDATPTSAPTDSASLPDRGEDHGPGRRGFRGAMDLEVAAKALGVTADELRTQLKAGRSLADVAKAEGVDKQAVIDALVTAAEKRLDEAKAALPDLIAGIVDGKLPAGGPGHMGDMGGMGGMGPGGFGNRGGGRNLATAAKALGVTADELRTQLKAGKSLAEVAKAEGVDKQTVIDALVADATTRLAKAVKSGKLTQAESDIRSADLADRIAQEVDEVHRGGPRKAGD